MRERLSTTALRSARAAGLLWAIALILVIIAAVALPPFRSAVSVNSLLASLAPVLLIATGQGLVVLFGGIDLSVGAVAGLATVALSLQGLVPGGGPVAVLLAIAAGLVVGLINGLGVLAGINPLLMTFAMAGVIQGSGLLLEKAPGTRMPLDLIRALTTAFGPIPLFAIIAIVVLVVVWLWVSQSRTGRFIQAAGFDSRIASRLGFPVARTTVIVYALAGVLASIGGVAIASRTFTADALVGASSVIDSVATVLVAGIAITGGVGSVLSILPAAVVISVVGQIITLTGTDPSYQTIFKGVLLLAAMGVYQLAGSGIRIPSALKRPAYLPRGGTR